MTLQQLLGISLPIIQAPMAGVQGSALAVAVSNAGGLGSLVAETLFDAGIQRPMVRVGIPDRFVECGSLPFLQEKCRMSVPQIVALAEDISW